MGREGSRTKDIAEALPTPVGGMVNVVEVNTTHFYFELEPNEPVTILASALSHVANGARLESVNWNSLKGRYEFHYIYER